MALNPQELTLTKRYSLFGGLAALFALIAMALVAGCGGKGNNPGAIAVIPAETLVAKFTSPTASVAVLQGATNDSYATLGFTTVGSPLFDRPTDPEIASSLANLQQVFNQNAVPPLTVAEVATTTGKDTPTALAATLNGFVAANYNGSNSYLRSLARMIVLDGSSTPATPPTVTTATTLQPYQAFYASVWLSLAYNAQVRSDACASVAYLDLYYSLYEAYILKLEAILPPSLTNNLRAHLSDVRRILNIYRPFCHAQG